MIDPKTVMVSGDRVSLPFEIVNEIFSLLQDLPARQSMNLILAIQQEAEAIQQGTEVVEDEIS